MTRFKSFCTAAVTAASLAALLPAPALSAYEPTPSEAVTRYVPLVRGGEGLLHMPAKGGARHRVALVFAHPSNNTFDDPVAKEMAHRGYLVLTLNQHGEEERLDVLAPLVGKGIAWLRRQPGVEKIVIVGHSGGGPLMAFYQNVAENGPGACSGPEKIIACRADILIDLPKADGVVLLDPTVGAFHQMTSIDPAAGDYGRLEGVDMFAAANGYDAEHGKANYAPAFRRRYVEAQAARGAELTRKALRRLAEVEAGKGDFSDDEPFIVRGMGVHAFGARIYQADASLLSRTARPHLLLRANGRDEVTIVSSVRQPNAQNVRAALSTLAQMGNNTTVRTYLAQAAIRTNADYDVTADAFQGVDWPSAFNSAPSNVRGITAPTLVLSMSCHYLLVHGETIFDGLAAKDKQFAVVEGATHLFSPCRPDYGDTVKRSFDFVDKWLSQPGRF